MNIWDRIEHFITDLYACDYKTRKKLEENRSISRNWVSKSPVEFFKTSLLQVRHSFNNSREIEWIGKVLFSLVTVACWSWNDERHL